MDYIFDHWQIFAAILVPDVIAGGGSSGGTLVDVLLANLIRDSQARPRP